RTQTSDRTHRLLGLAFDVATKRSPRRVTTLASDRTLGISKPQLTRQLSRGGNIPRRGPVATSLATVRVTQSRQSGDRTRGRNRYVRWTLLGSRSKHECGRSRPKMTR